MQVFLELAKRSLQLERFLAVLSGQGGKFNNIYS